LVGRFGRPLEEIRSDPRRIRNEPRKNSCTGHLGQRPANSWRSGGDPHRPGPANMGTKSPRLDAGRSTHFPHRDQGFKRRGPTGGRN